VESLRCPVLKLSRDRIEARRVIWPGQKHVLSTEVTGIARETRRRIVLTTRVHAQRTIPLHDLSQRDRVEARKAIREWVERAASPPSPA
jgi:hypothetical protein